MMKKEWKGARIDLINELKAAAPSKSFWSIVDHKYGIMELSDYLEYKSSSEG